MQSHPRSFWADVVGEVERGDALLDVARRHKVNPSTLRWWRSELRRHPISGPRFLPVVVSPPREPVPVVDPRGAPHLEVVVRDIVVRVPLGTDIAYVADLITALGAC